MTKCISRIACEMALPIRVGDCAPMWGDVLRPCGENVFLEARWRGGIRSFGLSDVSRRDNTAP